jgi:hypothetical protein
MSDVLGDEHGAMVGAVASPHSTSRAGAGTETACGPTRPGYFCRAPWQRRSRFAFTNYGVSLGLQAAGV